jgi:hypothetical protein
MRPCMLKFLDVPKLFATETCSCTGVQVSCVLRVAVLCHRTTAILFERSSRDEKPSPLLDDGAFLPYYGNGVDSSASSALTAQDADDYVQSQFVTEFMPVKFEDF